MSVSFVAEKCAIFDRRSTIVKIVSLLFNGDGGNLVTKSIAISCQVLLGMGRGRKRPWLFFPSALRFWQESHVSM